MKHLLLIALLAGSLFAADATGKWTGTLTPSDGSGGGPAILVLKQEGAKVTGTGGPEASDQKPIENGKVANDTVSFEINAGGGVMKFSLKQTGDQLKGDVTMEGGGQKRTATIDVKRQK